MCEEQRLTIDADLANDACEGRRLDLAIGNGARFAVGFNALVIVKATGEQ